MAQFTLIGTSQFRLATFQVLISHIYIVRGSHLGQNNIDGSVPVGKLPGYQ